MEFFKRINFSQVLSILSIISLVLMAFMFKKIMFDDPNISRQEYLDLKQSVIEQSKLIEVYEGRYQKVINDLNTSKTLNQSLKDTNEKLYDEIRESNNRLVAMASTVISFKSKEETITLKEELKPNQELTFEYPNKENPFVFHTVKFNDFKNIISRWNFDKLPVDIVVTEDSRGVFTADLASNDFVNVNSLTVNTLPMEQPKDYSYSYGAGIWGSLKEGGIDLYGGLRYKSYNLNARLQPNVIDFRESQVGISIIYSPK